MLRLRTYFIQSLDEGLTDEVAHRCIKLFGQRKVCELPLQWQVSPIFGLCGTNVWTSRSKLEIGQRQLGNVKVLPKVESFLVKLLVNGFGESDVMVQDISGPFSSSNHPRQLSSGNLKQCDLALSHFGLYYELACTTCTPPPSLPLPLPPTQLLPTAPPALSAGIAPSTNLEEHTQWRL